VSLRRIVVKRSSIALLFALAALAAAPGPGASAADNYFMGHSVYGYSGYSPGGSLYINALPSDAEVRLDGVLLGRANDLQASPVEARAGVHTLTFEAPGYEPTRVLVRVVRDWTTRVRLTLIPAR
jgi:PEGA domain